MTTEPPVIPESALQRLFDISKSKSDWGFVVVSLELRKRSTKLTLSMFGQFIQIKMPFSLQEITTFDFSPNYMKDCEYGFHFLPEMKTLAIHMGFKSKYIDFRPFKWVNRQSFRELHPQKVPFIYQHREYPDTFSISEETEVEINTIVQELEIYGVKTGFKRVLRRLWFEFSEEMGSEKGSWKGGTLGAGLTLESGESVNQGIKRAQKELRLD